MSLREFGGTAEGRPWRTVGATYGMAAGLLGTVRLRVRTLLCSCGVQISGNEVAVGMVLQSASGQGYESLHRVRPLQPSACAICLYADDGPRIRLTKLEKLETSVLNFERQVEDLNYPRTGTSGELVSISESVEKR